MIIAIDYDNTYTGDPETFDKLILLFQEAGHTVICVTARPNDPAWTEPVMKSIGKLVPVIFAGKEWKRDAARRRGWKVDVWIDDNPEYVAPQLLIKP